MTLKLRYASALMVILLIICIFTWGIATCVTKGQYSIAVVLAALLYGISFILGKKFKKVFFLLSTIKLLKDSNGVASMEAIASHIERGDKNSEELTREIVQLLLTEEVVERQDDNLILTGE
ncbi:hypothetical protein [Desulforhopalus sp. 52FAK]